LGRESRRPRDVARERCGGAGAAHAGGGATGAADFAGFEGLGGECVFGGGDFGAGPGFQGAGECVAVGKWLQEDASSSTSVPQNFKVYPNPSQDVFNIEFDGDATSKYMIMAYDMSGRLVGEQAIRPGISNKIKLGKQTPGLYFFQVLKDGLPWKTGKIQLI
jgi:Secretion system C-terminal sorting domain